MALDNNPCCDSYICDSSSMSSADDPCFAVKIPPEVIPEADDLQHLPGYLIFRTSTVNAPASRSFSATPLSPVYAALVQEEDLDGNEASRESGDANGHGKVPVEVVFWCDNIVESDGCKEGRYPSGIHR